MKKSALLLLVFGAILLASSCGDNDACDTVVCLYDGFCEEGICACEPGFEGDSCETLTREKLTGNYTITSTCDDGSAPTTTWAVAASASALTDILINNFHEPAFNLTATIVADDVFEIKETFLSTQGVTYNVIGSGTFDGDGNIDIDYQLVSASSATTITCSVVATRQ